MLRILFICILSLSFSLQAKIVGNINIESSCDGIEEAKQRLNVASSNYLNVATTKTPAGTFYRKKIVRECAKGKCTIISLNRFEKKYLPQHPDADTRGYVKFPEIDKGQELAVVEKMVVKLRNLAHDKVCKSKLLVHRHNRNIFLIKYNDDPMSDKFVFANNKIVSWTIRSPFGDNTITFN